MYSTVADTEATMEDLPRVQTIEQCPIQSQGETQVNSTGRRIMIDCSCQRLGRNTNTPVTTAALLVIVVLVTIAIGGEMKKMEKIQALETELKIWQEAVKFDIMGLENRIAELKENLTKLDATKRELLGLWHEEVDTSVDK